MILLDFSSFVQRFFKSYLIFIPKGPPWFSRIKIIYDERFCMFNTLQTILIWHQNNWFFCFSLSVMKDNIQNANSSYVFIICLTSIKNLYYLTQLQILLSIWNVVRSRKCIVIWTNHAKIRHLILMEFILKWALNWLKS